MQPTGRADNSTILVVLNVKVKMEAQYSLPPHSFNNLLQESFTFQNRWKLKRGYGLMQHWIVNYPCYKEVEEPIMIAYGIKWNCEHFQATGIETA